MFRSIMEAFNIKQRVKSVTGLLPWLYTNVVKLTQPNTQMNGMYYLKGDSYCILNNTSGFEKSSFFVPKAYQKVLRGGVHSSQIAECKLCLISQYIWNNSFLREPLDSAACIGASVLCRWHQHQTESSYFSCVGSYTFKFALCRMIRHKKDSEIISCWLLKLSITTL
jgi:hypothetical protein